MGLHHGLSVVCNMSTVQIWLVSSVVGARANVAWPAQFGFG